MKTTATYTMPPVEQPKVFTYEQIIQNPGIYRRPSASGPELISFGNRGAGVTILYIGSASPNVRAADSCWSGYNFVKCNIPVTLVVDPTKN